MTNKHVNLDKQIFEQPKELMSRLITYECMNSVGQVLAGQMWDPLRTEVWEPVSTLLTSIERSSKDALTSSVL